MMYLNMYSDTQDILNDYATREGDIMTDRVGFAGTGLMGRGMAKNILAAGYPLAVVAHRSRAPIEALVRQGATELHSYRNLAAGSDVVVLCVTGTPEVESWSSSTARPASPPRPSASRATCTSGAHP